ncbi:MAG: UrcA family protein [Woeseiaceae bacterium]|nr:UrcA family protein [Woeseiaceae bacterium]
MNPKLTFSFKSAAVLIFAMAGLVMNIDLAIAQVASEEQISEDIPEVIVVAPKQDTTGFRTVTDKLSRTVSYADLDLTEHADVIEFENRIETAAKEVCKELNQMQPIPKWVVPDFRRCEKNAIRGTKKQVEAAIAAAS